jgi:hypothetical protein
MDLWPAALELGSLLPGCEIALHLVGPHVPAWAHGCAVELPSPAHTACGAPGCSCRLAAGGAAAAQSEGDGGGRVELLWHRSLYHGASSLEPAHVVVAPNAGEPIPAPAPQEKNERPACPCCPVPARSGLEHASACPAGAGEWAAPLSGSLQAPARLWILPDPQQTRLPTAAGLAAYPSWADTLRCLLQRQGAPTLAAGEAAAALGPGSPAGKRGLPSTPTNTGPALALFTDFNEEAALRARLLVEAVAAEPRPAGGDTASAQQPQRGGSSSVAGGGRGEAVAVSGPQANPFRRPLPERPQDNSLPAFSNGWALWLEPG